MVLYFLHNTYLTRYLNVVSTNSVSLPYSSLSGGSISELVMIYPMHRLGQLGAALKLPQRFLCPTFSMAKTCFRPIPLFVGIKLNLPPPHFLSFCSPPPPQPSAYQCQVPRDHLPPIRISRDYQTFNSAPYFQTYM